MRTINYFLATLTLLFISSCANGPSDQVKSAFEVKVPEASHVDWKNLNGNWEVTYDLEGTECVSLFRPDGAWLNTKRLMNYDLIPKVVWNNFASEFEEGDLLNVYRVEKESETYYEFRMKNDVDIYIVDFNEDGSFRNRKPDV